MIKLKKKKTIQKKSSRKVRMKSSKLAQIRKKAIITQLRYATTHLLSKNTSKGHYLSSNESSTSEFGFA